jgi:hypothetical protein
VVAGAAANLAEADPGSKSADAMTIPTNVMYFMSVLLGRMIAMLTQYPEPKIVPLALECAVTSCF